MYFEDLYLNLKLIHHTQMHEGRNKRSFFTKEQKILFSQNSLHPSTSRSRTVHQLLFRYRRLNHLHHIHIMQQVAEEDPEKGAAWATTTAAQPEEVTPLINNAPTSQSFIYGSPPPASLMPSTSSFISSNTTCSSAVTPRFSNVTIDDDSDNDGNNNPPPRVPSMSSTTSLPARSSSTNNRPTSSSRVPPPRQKSSLHRPLNNGSGNGGSSEPLHSTRSSRIKTSSTLIILVLGLFLAISTLFQYFVMGPDSFNLPPDLDSNNSDGGSTIGEGVGAEGGRSSSSKAKRKQQQHNDVKFDEFGRYIVEDYDANPPFSDILPVSASC